MQPTVAEATPRSGELPNAEPMRGVACSDAAVPHRRAIQPECVTCPPLAHLVRPARVSHGLPLGGGRHHFRLFTSFRIALSSIASASSFLSFAFSSSSDFKRLASDTSKPPNFAFHLMGWTALPP